MKPSKGPGDKTGQAPSPHVLVAHSGRPRVPPMTREMQVAEGSFSLFLWEFPVEMFVTNGVGGCEIKNGECTVRSVKSL